jgi:LysR family transcriptional regulator, low CO2-responsive transcriptional regulator
MQIADLEATLEVPFEVPLFERAGRKIYLTTAGEYFLVHARRLLANLKDAEDTIARLKGVQTSRLTIGVLSTAKYFMPRLMAGFMREHPGLDLRLEVGNRQALSELLARNELDLAVMGTPPRELDVRVEPFAAHPLGVIAAPEHPLAALPHIPPALLDRESFHRPRDRIGHACGDGALLRRRAHQARGDHGDVEQRDDQAGGDREHGHFVSLAPHHRARS